MDHDGAREIVSCLDGALERLLEVLALVDSAAPEEFVAYAVMLGPAAANVSNMLDAVCEEYSEFCGPRSIFPADKLEGGLPSDDSSLKADTMTRQTAEAALGKLTAVLADMGGVRSRLDRTDDRQREHFEDQTAAAEASINAVLQRLQTRHPGLNVYPSNGTSKGPGGVS